MLKILLITLILVAVAFAGLAIRILLERNGKFSGGSCQSGNERLSEKGISCGCGGGPCSNTTETGVTEYNSSPERK